MLSHPEIIDGQDVVELEKLVKDFPYFTAAQVLLAVGIPTVEVHISAVERREDFRQISYVRRAALKTITGRGIDGYCEAMDYLIDREKTPCE